jgi:uncharacterized membrane protein YfcA
MSYLLLFFAAGLAFGISALCGGGAGLLLIPVLGSFLPVTQVPAALTLGTATSSLSRLGLFSKSICWSMAYRFVPASLVGAVLGAQLLAQIDPMYVEFFMGVFLVANLPLLIRPGRGADSSEVEPVQASTLIVIGIIAGVISALTGAVGVLFNRFYLRSGLSPQEIVATRAANEILLHLFKLILYAQLHLFDVRVLQFGVIVAVAAVGSSRLMVFVLPKIPKALFARIGQTAMVLVGMLMLNSSVIHIQSAADPGFRIQRLSREVEANLTWNHLVYSLEFNYGEGPEFEKVIPITRLSPERQAELKSLVSEGEELVVEKVFSLEGISYEAVFLGPDHRVIRKMEFIEN